MITFVQPWWLVLLPAWPLLVLLARRRRERAPRPTPDFLLWRRVASRLGEPTPRTRPSWRDLAWIAPLALLTLALARPAWTRASDVPGTVVLLDGGPSMRAERAGATRASRGLAEARALLGGATPSAVTETAPGDLAAAAVAFGAARRVVLVVTDRDVGGLPSAAGIVRIADDATNAGITAAGLDERDGLLVRVDGDPGCGARTLVVTATPGGEIARHAIGDARRFRVVVPSAAVPAKTTAIDVAIEPADAIPGDDRVRLLGARRDVRAAVAPSWTALERALRAHPGVVVSAGDDPAGDLAAGARARPDAHAILVAPADGAAGFRTGPAALRDGALAGRGAFEGLGGFARIPELHALGQAPDDVERLIEIAGLPLLVRSGRTFLFLADPEAGGLAALPAFPLAIARIVEIVATESAGALSVLAPLPGRDDVRVAHGVGALSRAPAAPPAELMRTDVTWACCAVAAAVMAVLVARAFTSRRGGATPRTRRASVRGAGRRRMARS